MAKRKHVVGTNPYFRVSGERKEVVLDAEEKPMGSRVLPSRTRFESLELGDSERFATDVYKREGIVLEIHEMPRGAVS